jgi:carboxylesterase type B
VSRTDLDPNDEDRDREEGEVKEGEESRVGQRILAFRGIPYAKPPVGQLRFRTPVPIGKHGHIKDVKINGHVCPQHMYYKPDIWIGTVL